MKILEGKKTYISVIVLLVGFLGFADLVTPENVASIINGIFEIIGTLGVIYGRYNAKPKV